MNALKSEPVACPVMEPTPENRIAVAQDVLKYIKTEKIKAKRGRWLKVKIPKGINETVQAKDVLEEVETCQACMVGAMLYATLRRFNDMTLDNLDSAAVAERQIDVHFGTGSSNYNYLTRLFPGEQIRQMEACFERFGGIYDEFCVSAPTGIKAFIENVHKKHGKSATAMMKAICKNIIKNNGTFEP